MGSGHEVEVLFAAGVCVFDQGRVLLVRRADFDVWCLPAGMVDPGESVHEAAQRELEEEAGAVSELGPLRGLYSEVGGWADVHIAIFRADGPVEMSACTPESTDHAWFPTDQLPDDMFWWNRRYIADASTPGTDVHVERVDITCRLGRVSRPDLYAACDQFDGTPSEFFAWCFPAPAATGTAQ